MSLALYNNLGGLRFWTEAEIRAREHAISTLHFQLSTELQKLNSAWTFHRVEGPLLTPASYVNPTYGQDDVFITKAEMGDETIVLRPETTASSYLYANHLLTTGQAKAPLCIWQAGKSFRRETSDGATAAKLRFNEFYQCEFQCIYKEGTKADVRAYVEMAIARAIRELTYSDSYRIIESDRLPSYSTQTRDIEVEFNGSDKEMASISTRTDFPGYIVLEAAVGLDRLVSVQFNRNA